MKKIYSWLFDTLCGHFFLTGILVCLWIIIYSIFKAPEINFKNFIFLIEFNFILWIFNFIFHFNSPMLAKGALHSIICFMLSTILFLINFDYVPSVSAMIVYMILFFALYWSSLLGIIKLSKKANSPLRHFTEWLFKLSPSTNTKVYESQQIPID